MYWADRIASELKKRNLPLEWVDDMKTPSGKIHVGSLRGVIIHDLIFRALIDLSVKAHYTYVFDDHDPMDALPTYLSKEKYEQYMGYPLNKIPSPEPGFNSLADYYAQDFINVFTRLGVKVDIIWASKLYQNGKMDTVIKECLDKVKIIRNIYRQVSNSKKTKDWYPFQAICEKCGKLGTTKVYDWDGEEISYHCQPDMVAWAKGCGHKSKISPFGGNGKLFWKVEWAAMWKVIGVTCEGAGKDHMTKGGSHDIAEAICKKILNYPTPFPFTYEWFLTGGKSMSSSKGIGFSARKVAEILPPEILRFLMVRVDYHQAINFDLNGITISDLFDEYDRCAKEFWENGTKSDFGRIYELSQINQTKPQKMVSIRFRQMIQLVQMPNVGKEIINSLELEERAKYARLWLENFATEDDKFQIKKEMPLEAGKLSETQKKLLAKISGELEKNWEAENLQTEIYNWGKELGLTPNETFQSIYLSLLGKDHGPKAAWLILSLDKEFLKKRFQE